MSECCCAAPPGKKVVRGVARVVLVGPDDPNARLFLYDKWWFKHAEHPEEKVGDAYFRITSYEPEQIGIGGPIRVEYQTMGAAHAVGENVARVLTHMGREALKTYYVDEVRGEDLSDEWSFRISHGG